MTDSNTVAPPPSPSHRRGKIIVFSAPSGGGKSRLIEGLRNLEGRAYQFSISATTRAPREATEVLLKEEHGREYYFHSRKEFEDMIARGEFIEYAENFGNYYGTLVAPIKQALESGQTILLDVNAKGLTKLKEIFPDDVVSLFICPPSPEILKDRLIKRNQNKDADLESRIREAVNEIHDMDKYDCAIINHDVPSLVADADSVIRAASNGATRDALQLISHTTPEDLKEVIRMFDKLPPTVRIEETRNIEGRVNNKPVEIDPSQKIQH